MTIITNSNKEAILPSQENLKSCPCTKKHYYVLDGIDQGSPEPILSWQSFQATDFDEGPQSKMVLKLLGARSTLRIILSISFHAVGLP